MHSVDEISPRLRTAMQEVVALDMEDTFRLRRMMRQELLDIGIDMDERDLERAIKGAAIALARRPQPLPEALEAASGVGGVGDDGGEGSDAQQPEPGDVSIEGFLAREFERLIRFAAVWRANAKANPSEFPLTMPLSDWVDQYEQIDPFEHSVLSGQVLDQDM